MAKVTSISLTNYSYQNPVGHVHIDTDFGNIVIRLNEKDAGRLMTLAMQIVEEKRDAMAAQVAAVELPPLIENGTNKVIDDGEIPF